MCVCVRALRGDEAANNIEVDAEVTSLGDEETIFALEAGIAGSAAESEQDLAGLRMVLAFGACLFYESDRGFRY